MKVGVHCSRLWLSRLCVLLFQYVVVHISPDQMLSFGGTDEPCAIANLYSIGCLSPKENKKHSAVLFEHIEKTLGIKGNRYLLQGILASISLQILQYMNDLNSYKNDR